VGVVAGGPPATARSSTSAVSAPSSCTSRLTTDSGGCEMRTFAESSQASTDRSCGTRTPSRAASRRPASGIRSLSYTIAVGGSGSASSSAVRRAPLAAP
jgi:hypothetical protein